MVKEQPKTEETKTEEKNTTDTEALNAAIEKGEQETKNEIPEVPEIPKEALDISAEFDKKRDSDDDDAAVDDDKASDDDTSEDKTGDDKTAEDKKAAEEKDASGKKSDDDKTDEKAGEQTAEDKEIEEAAAAIEKEAVAEAGKTDEQKAAEKVVAEAAEKAKADAEVTKKAEAEVDDKPFSCGLPTEGDEDFDPDIVGAIDKVGQTGRDLAKRVKVLEGNNAELISFLSQQGNQRHADWLDSKINNLGEDFHEVLGAGESYDLEPGSDQLEARIKIGNRMTFLAKAHQQMKKAVPSRNKLFDSAVTFLHKEIKNKSKTEKGTKDKLTKRAGQVIGGASKKVSALSAEAEVLKIQKDFDAKRDDED